MFNNASVRSVIVRFLSERNRSRLKSICVHVSPENQRWLPKLWVFVRDYTRNIFKFDFRNDDLCFFVWIYEMEQFKLKVGWCYALIFNQWGI